MPQFKPLGHKTSKDNRRICAGHIDDDQWDSLLLSLNFDSCSPRGFCILEDLICLKPIQW